MVQQIQLKNSVFLGFDSVQVKKLINIYYWPNFLYLQYILEINVFLTL